MVVKYSSEWWRQQPGARGQQIDYSASQGAPGTGYRTPSGTSVRTTKGSEYRPIYKDGNAYVAGQAPANTSAVWDPNYKQWNWADNGSDANVPTTTTNLNNRNTSGGSGGGYSGPRINAAGIIAAMNKYRPQMFKPDLLKLQQYKPPAFYGFDDSTYEMMKQQIAKSIAQARTTGMNAYGEARQQLNNIPVAFQGGATTTDPGMSAAMQRMFAANDTPLSINEQTLNEGVQADAAFGNVMALLGEAARQRRTSDVTALGGDERRLNETLDQQQTMLQFQADFARAEALRQYEIEKWQFGEQVARANWEVRNAQISANTQIKNDAKMTNINAANEANQAANQTIIDLLAQGVAVDPATYQPVKV